MKHFDLLLQRLAILALAKRIFLSVLLWPVIHLSLSRPCRDYKEAPVLDVDGLHRVGSS